MDSTPVSASVSGPFRPLMHVFLLPIRGVMGWLIATVALGDAGKQPRRHHRQEIFNGATVLSDPRSELTCNASGSRKRAREESMAATANNITGVRLLESGAASTSGRHAPSSQPASPLARDLVSLLYQQNLEIDALVRLEVS